MIKKSFFLRIGVFLFIISGVLCSCDGLLLSKSETLLSTGMCKMTVNMGFSRSAYPSSLPSTVTYYATIYNADKTVYLTETGSSSGPSFLENKGTNSNLSFVFKEPDNTTKGTYFLSVYGSKTGIPTDISTGLLGTSASFELKVGQKNINTPLTITFISDNSTTTGDITLSLALSTGLGSKVSIEKSTILCTNIETGVSVTLTKSILGSGFLTLSGTNIPVGSYYLDITFKDTNGKWISTDYTRQTLSVYSGFVTDTWYNIDGFVMDTLSIGYASVTSFYVCGSSPQMYGNLIPKITEGNDTTGTGSIINPFSSLQKAINIINSINDGVSTYNVYVDGELTDTDVDRSSNNDAFINISSTKPLNLNIVPAPNNTNVIINASRTSSSTNKASVMYVDVDSSGTLAFQNLVIKGGYTTGEGDGGGGIYVAKGNLILKECSVENNYSTEHGGGIYVKNTGSVVLDNTTIKENTANENGGGLYVNVGSVTMTNSSASDNISANGGGIYVYQGSVTMTDSIVSNNTTSANGAGVYVNGTFTMNGSSEVSSDNDVYLADSKVITVGSTLSKNPAAVITAETRENTVKVLSVESGATANIAEESQKFELSQKEGELEAVINENGLIFLVGMNMGTLGDINDAIDLYTTNNQPLEIKLAENLALSTTDSIVIPSGANVTFSADSPHTISVPSDYSDDTSGDKAAITVNDGGTLTLGNNVTLQGTNFGYYQVNAVYVKAGATFIMKEGSSISGFYGNGDATIAVYGTFNMEGGSITGNKARYGAAIYLYTGTIFNFSGGSITSNYSVNGYIIDGGSSSTMNWEGGTITNNNGSSGIIDANDTSITVYNTSGNTAS